MRSRHKPRHIFTIVYDVLAVCVKEPRNNYAIISKANINSGLNPLFDYLVANGFLERLHSLGLTRQKFVYITSLKGKVFIDKYLELTKILSPKQMRQFYTRFDLRTDTVTEVIS